MIEYLEWDSVFFGYKVGKLNFFNEKEFHLSFNKYSNNFHLIYVFSDQKLQFNGINLVDNKLIFVKKIDQTLKKNLNTRIQLYNEINKESNQELMALALLSGKYSRFKLDVNFKNNEFEKMYQFWIDKHINENKKIIVKKNSKELAGFILYSKRKNTIYIELIAVSEKYQGKGIASELINEIEVIGLSLSCEYIEVATQSINNPAVNLYKKNNFELINSIFIYHYWNI